MLKRTLTLAALILAVGAGTAQAHPRLSFTLRQAHAVMHRTDRNEWQGFHAHIIGCGWHGHRHHNAYCSATIRATIIDGQPAQSFVMTYDVTRDGACGTGSGHHTDVGWRNCFNGPLVAIPVSIN